MKTKKDIEKIGDNISPEIGPGIPPLIARSDKTASVTAEQETKDLMDTSADKRT